MTQRALHSAVMEVGLYYQKGWTVDHISWFTFHLQRRRLRAREKAARTRWAARASHGQALAVPYQIESHPDRSVAYAVSASMAGARTANERLFDRVRARLGRRQSRPAAIERLGLPCSECGQPAVGWNYAVHDVDGERVIDGYATCAAHRSNEALEPMAASRTG